MNKIYQFVLDRTFKIFCHSDFCNSFKPWGKKAFDKNDTKKFGPRQQYYDMIQLKGFLRQNANLTSCKSETSTLLAQKEKLLAVDPSKNLLHTD